MFNNLKIKSKFIMLYVLGIFLPLTVVMVFFTNSITEETISREKKNGELSFERAVSQMKEQFSGVYTLSNAIGTDNQLKPLLSKNYSAPADYYLQYFNGIRPAVQRYINAYNRHVSNISIYTNNNTAFSGGVCLDLKEASSFSWMLPEGGGMYKFIPHIVIRPGQVSKMQISLIRKITGISPYYGIIRVDLTMENITRSITQEKDYLDIYLVSADGRIVCCSDNQLSLTPEKLRTTPAPSEYDMEFSLDSIGGMQGWRVLAQINTLPMEKSVRRVQILCLMMEIVCLIFTGVLTYLMLNSITKRSNKLLKAMDDVDPERFVKVDSPVYKDEIGEITLHYNAMIERIQDLIQDVYYLQLQKNSIELERVKSELKYLQAQLDPHFLFNTLNGIMVKCVKNGYNDVAQVIGALSKIMRRMIDSKEDTTTLQEEISFVKLVLQLEKFRFGDKLTYGIDIPQELLDSRIPVMCVQGLVENACKHGVQPLEGVGRIDISASRENDSSPLIISVADNGIGMSDEQLQNLLRAIHTKENTGGIGLQNIYRRLKLSCGDKADMTIVSHIGEGTRIQLIIY